MSEHTSGYDPAAGDEEYLLEEILAEYGGGRQRQILAEAEEKIAAEAAQVPEAEPVPPEKKTLRTKARRRPVTEEEPPPEKEIDLPPDPKPISLEEIVGSTVDAVMVEQQEERQERLVRPRRGLFSRKKLPPETEQLPPVPEPEKEEDPIGAEVDLGEMAELWRRRCRRRMWMPVVWLSALLPTLPLLLERWGRTVPYWSGDLHSQSLALLVCLLVTAGLCWQVFEKAVRTLQSKRCTGEVAVALSALLAIADCCAALLSQSRTQVLPYAAVTTLALAFAQWGVNRERQGWYDTYRTAALDDEPPYLVTETGLGACKQRGSIPGFYTTAQRDSAATLVQSAFLPVVLMASLVLGVLSSFGRGRSGDFLLNWSAILAGGTAFALPLCWALPFSKLASHLQKAGAAVAGWCGAEKISRKKCMILTDTDLFPPGTMELNGVKVFGEELYKANSYAASMARSAGSGLERLFDRTLRSEGGQYETVESFSFFEEGGWSGTIHGETVLMGTASFMRKSDVRLPGGINLKTGIFLAVDRQMIAVFAVKYEAAETVDFALRMMRRSHITPVLASRDPNIQPPLLKRKFYKGLRVEYPGLTARIAMSEAEQDRGIPRGLLLREGLLPYAELVAGSRRLCRAVGRSLLLSLLASVTGTLLTFYLIGLGSYELLTPLALELFQLLWVLPPLLVADWAGRY